MAYSRMAKAVRRCRGTRKDGEPCQAYAVWDDPRGLCAAHGRHHTGPLPKRYAPHKKSSYPPCRCRAYQWPHRPGGGLCEWPDVPEYRLLTPLGTKSVFNGNPWRVYSLGSRLNRQREEKRFQESLQPSAEPEGREPERPRPRPTPEPGLTRQEEIEMVMARMGMRPGGR